MKETIVLVKRKGWLHYLLTVEGWIRLSSGVYIPKPITGGKQWHATGTTTDLIYIREC